MLQDIRDKAQGWVTWLIIGVIIVVFALFGISYYLTSNGGADSTLATVNGDPITQSSFNYMYQSISRQQTDASVDTNALKQQVLQSLISRQLLLQSAQDLGFHISVPQLNQVIYSMAPFQVDGQFSMPRYQAILQNAGITTDQLRTELLTDIIVGQVQQGVTLSQFVLPNELAQLNAAIGQKRDISYVLLPSSKFASAATISQSQIQAYYEANQSDFYTTEQVQLHYIMLDASHMPKGQSYGDVGNQLANLSYESPSSLDATAKQLGLSVSSTGLITQKGGSGWLANPQVIQAAFSDSVLKQGNNSAIINLSPSQCVVIRVLKDIPSTLKPLSEVSNQILAILQGQAGQQLAQQTASAMLASLQQDGSAASSLAKQYGLKWQQANNLGRNSTNLDPAIVDAAFSTAQPLATHPIPALATTTNGFAVILVNKAISTNIASNPADALALQHAWAVLDYSQYTNALTVKASIKVNS
ncbi:MAG: SurA N-terminal domain-containing protein [Gammaproteobacteria bacterium]|nr:SurA N-terminal domain-containing protein [Gammaproteobacteria bacterium]